MTARPHDRAAPPAAPPLPPAPPARERGLATLGYAIALVVLLAAVVHPLRHWVVEPRRQMVLGNREPAARRLALASQFGFTTAAGARIRLVPGQAQTELRDVPTHAVTLILGGFRGPYVIWLWMKVEDEKQKRIHFDLIDRYTKIVALQSDYPAVWVHLIWNLGWNLPVQWQSPDIRYKWIRLAIDFGTEGYRRNPHDAEIMAEIGRVYSDKLGRSQEASYYRRRVKEDEGRSTFLIAYEWYDRARRANERQATLLHGLTKVVVYSQAPHNLSYFATETTLEGYDLLKESLDLRRAGREDAARDAFERGTKTLREAEPEWDWARREWRAHAVRFEKEGIPSALNAVYRRFYDEADAATRNLHAFDAELTYDNLPLYHAAKLMQGAFAALGESSKNAAQEGMERVARDAFKRGANGLDEAIAQWEWALPLWNAHLASLETAGASAETLQRAKDLRDKVVACISYLKETRKSLAPGTLEDVLKAMQPPPVSWPMPGLSL